MKKTEIFEGDRALHYDNAIRKWFPLYDELLELYFPILKSKLNDRKQVRILVVGSGTGNELNTLARLKPDWYFTGVDPSPVMNAIAREKNAGLPNVEIIEGRIEDISGEFEAVICALVTHFFDIETKIHIFQHIHKRLVPGGILIQADITGDKNDFKANFGFYTSYQQLNIDDDTLEKGLTHLEHDLHYLSEEELARLIKQTGFNKMTKFFQWLMYEAWIIER